MEHKYYCVCDHFVNLRRLCKFEFFLRDLELCLYVTLGNIHTLVYVVV